MSEFTHIMALPLLACLILVGIHAYLGFHVIERQVIFVDLALAQIAVLGASFSVVMGQGWESFHAYILSLGFTIIGAGIFSLTRFRHQHIPQEALIGITYVVSAALLMIVFSRSGEGDEHIRQALIGNILLVSWSEVIKIAIIYLFVGAFHFIYRDKFLAISKDPEKAFKGGLNVRFWDFLFYISFGIVVTSSVKIAGVLLVFSFLIIPSVCAMLFSNQLKMRLALGWGIGVIGSILGMGASYFFDFPTAASVVCVLAAILLLCLSLKPRIC